MNFPASEETKTESQTQHYSTKDIRTRSEHSQLYRNRFNYRTKRNGAYLEDYRSRMVFRFYQKSEFGTVGFNEAQNQLEELAFQSQDLHAST